MASKAQIRANRNNARKSTGPKTVEGKNMVRRNAITHGIFTQASILSEEEAEELSALAKSIIEECEPQTQIEAALTDRVIQAIWRQRRLQRAETAHIMIAQLPTNLITEVNIALGFEHSRWKNANDLKDAKPAELTQQALRQRLKEEFATMDIEKVANDPNELTSFPLLLAQIKNQASKLNLSWENYCETPQLIRGYLTKLKENIDEKINDYYEGELVRLIGNMVKDTKLIPKANLMDQLMKYQVQLDNDLYKALNELRKAQQYRMINVEAEVINES